MTLYQLVIIILGFTLLLSIQQIIDALTTVIINALNYISIIIQVKANELQGDEDSKESVSCIGFQTQEYDEQD